MGGIYMEDYILECCVDSVESAINAKNGGASRLELCSNLIIGGTTPDVALVKEIRKHTDIRMHALIRPRFGDFCYTQHEMEIMRAQIRALKEAGVEGVVIGVLDEEGNLDVRKMQELLQEASGLSVTLHRAFDMCREPFQTLDEAIQLGIDTILTSGQKQSAWEGRELLKELIEKAEGRIDIMAGAGVCASVIEKLIPVTGGTSYHMSGKVTLDSPMRYRKKEVNMGLPSLSEYEIWQTSEEAVREAAQVLCRV
jgi:copper homeostasis protein